MTMVTLDRVRSPLDPSIQIDPHGYFAHMREANPICRVEHAVVLFRRHDIERLYLSPAASVEAKRTRWSPAERSMIMRDPPDHSRLRRPLNKAFTQKMMNGLRPLIQRLSDEMLDRVAEAGECDIVETLAFPLPFEVISGMLGVPMSDNDRVREWSSDLTAVIDPKASEELVAKAEHSEREFGAFMSDFIAWKRRNPGEDILSLLLEAEKAGEGLTAEELIDQMILLYIAGHENTTNFIANSLVQLLANPDQLEAWRRDPGLDRNAVEELLRIDPPLLYNRRVMIEDWRVDDETIAAGSFVLVCLASANRDSAFWGSNADKLDLSRENASRNLTFGHGIHHCLGAALARMEGQIAIGDMIRRFPRIELQEDELRYHPRAMMRGIERLRLTVAH